MTTYRRFRITIDVVATDPARIVEQARDIILDSGAPEAVDYIDDDEQLDNAVGWLFDAGSSKFDYALEIENSSTEEISE